MPNFNITVHQIAEGSATLSWMPPTENADGSALTDLAGYRIYYGRNPNTLNPVDRPEQSRPDPLRRRESAACALALRDDLRQFQRRRKCARDRQQDDQLARGIDAAVPQARPSRLSAEASSWPTWKDASRRQTAVESSGTSRTTIPCSSCIPVQAGD